MLPALAVAAPLALASYIKPIEESAKVKNKREQTAKRDQVLLRHHLEKLKKEGRLK